MSHSPSRHRYLKGAMVLSLGLAAAIVTAAMGSDRSPIGKHSGRRLCVIQAGAAGAASWRCIAGIGPVLADRLEVAVRTGRLRGGADLEHIHGIGPETAGHIRRAVRWSRSP